MFTKYVASLYVNNLRDCKVFCESPGVMKNLYNMKNGVKFVCSLLKTRNYLESYTNCFVQKLSSAFERKM